MQFRILLAGSLIVFFFNLQAQPLSYPQNYFRNPLGIPIQITANFGEIRPNHWHMGLDIRTQQRINLPVYAAAGGYIAHIGVRSSSFGQFIVVNHPNGLSTLYAHLNKFFPALESYITEQQYKKESWAIELDFTPNQFPVNKGTLIGYSGTTGGSNGPHLHFEIFDTKTTKRLNPLLFNMPLADNIPPIIVRLAMYDRSTSVYEQKPQLFSVNKSGKEYIVPTIKTGLNKLSFAIQAYDKTSGSKGPNGIYAALISLDAVPQVKFLLDSIDYDETKNINAQIDYKHDYNGGVDLQHLSQMPGDKSSVYKKISGDGIISLADTNIHQVEIKVWDADGNTSNLSFSVQYNEELSKKNEEKDDVDKIAPNSVHLMGKPGFEMLFPVNSIYDTVYQSYSRGNSMQGTEVSYSHTVNSPEIPLHDDVTVRIKPDKPVANEWKEKIIIQRTDKGKRIEKANWQGEWLVAKFGGFGTYQAIADITAPALNELGKGDTINLSAAKRIVFHPTDNFNVIKNFRAELDGHWLLFTNDKGKSWIYSFDERCPYGIHRLKVTVEDLVGNVTTKTWWFKRYPYTPPKKKQPVKKKTIKRKTTAKKN